MNQLVRRARSLAQRLLDMFLAKMQRKNEGDTIMLVLIATPTEEFLARRDAIRASWTVAERKYRALVAHVRQSELTQLLGLLPDGGARTDASTPKARRFQR
jgi:hypothetical protein